MEELIGVIRQVAVESIAAQHPVELCYGLIETVDPLQIRVDQALVLQREMLILPMEFVPQVGQCCLLMLMQGGQRYALLYICALEEDSKTE